MKRLVLIIALGSAFSIGDVHAQQHTTGLAITALCGDQIVHCPGKDTIRCRVEARNLDPDHGILDLAITLALPMVDGSLRTVVGCAETLAAGDGNEGGPDTTACDVETDVELSPEHPVDCQLASTLEVTATGVDADPVPVSMFGFGGLPISGSAVNRLGVATSAHFSRLTGTLTCTVPLSQTSAVCTVALENQDLYHGVRDLHLATQQLPSARGPIRRINNADCPTTLARSDGIVAAGADFAACTFVLDFGDICMPLDGVEVGVVVDGVDDDGVTVDQGGFGGTPIAVMATAPIDREAAPFPDHFFGLDVDLVCNPTVIPPGVASTCTVEVNNRDPDHGVDNLTISSEIPFPNGMKSAVTGCLPILPPGDGIVGGPDATMCAFVVESNAACSGSQSVISLSVTATGTDADTTAGGFGGLPVMNAATSSIIVLCGETSTTVDTK